MCDIPGVTLNLSSRATRVRKLQPFKTVSGHPQSTGVGFADSTAPNTRSTYMIATAILAV